jgi:hypothetical protein
MRSPTKIVGLKAPIGLTVHPVPTPGAPATRAGIIRARRRALATIYEVPFRQLTCLRCGGVLRGPELLGMAGTAVVVLWKGIRGGGAGVDLAGGESEPNRVEQHALQNASASMAVACAIVQSPEANAISAKEGTGTSRSKGATCQR